MSSLFEAMIEELPPLDHARRVEASCRRLATDDGGHDAWLLTDPTDIRWLTGFAGSTGWAVVRADEVVVGTDGRYAAKARAETDGTGVTIVDARTSSKLHEALVAAAHGATSVSADDRTMPAARWSDLASELPLSPCPSPIKVARQIKDDAEIARIEAAAAIADAALAEVEPKLGGMTELEVRAELEYTMIRLGADDRSYTTIVASGPVNAARPHHTATRRTLDTHHTVIIDVGAMVDGYHSDMTRSWVIGEASDRQRDLYQLVVDAQQAGLDAIEPGVEAREVDAACRRVFDQAGCLEWYLHGTGHGVGLEIHEPPFCSRTTTDQIRAGNVVTVEPGLYRDGVGGFRIEDLVLVTDPDADAHRSGHRMLTHSPKRELN